MDLYAWATAQERMTTARRTPAVEWEDWNTDPRCSLTDRQRAALEAEEWRAAEEWEAGRNERAELRLAGGR